MIKRLTVIGVGLIGGSLARALRRAGGVGHVAGVGRSLADLELAEQRGIIDAYTTNAAEAVTQADMVVIAVSVAASGEIFNTVRSALPASAVITDVGSAKGSVVAAARTALGDRFPRFVAGHPIAGTEHSGAGAAFVDLYVDHKVVLTPEPDTDQDALAQVGAMWTAVGADVISMPVDAHDRALAATSHLPHLLAFNLVDMLAQHEDGESIFDFAAGGFRDFTRIASSSPQMWTEIALANRDAVLASGRDYAERFEALLLALERGDSEALLAIFESARHTRNRNIVQVRKDGE